MNNKYTLYVLLLTGVMLGSCSGLRQISSEDPLYAGGKIHWALNDQISDYRELKIEISELQKPIPNKKILWMRPSIIIYRLAGNPKKQKGLKYTIKYKIGKPPVLLSKADPGHISKVMQNRIFNKGYFNCEVEYQVIRNAKTAEIEYFITPGDPNLIDTFYYDSKRSSLDSIIGILAGAGELMPETNYNLDRIKKERDRIETVLKDSGYYYFDKNYLVFRADTTTQRNRSKIALSVKPDVPAEASRIMYLNHIYLMDDYMPDRYEPDTVLFRDFNYLSERHLFKPGIIANEIFLNKGDKYSRSNYLRTINHLMGLGVYKFVNADFIIDPDSALMDARIFMTPLKKNTLSAEFNTVFRTTNYMGPGVNLSWKNRNLFGGAESFSVNFLGSFEVQVGADSINTSIEAGINLKLDLPRIVPFNFKNANFDYIPATSFNLGSRYYRRVELYTLSSYYINAGYNWRQKSFLFHRLIPVDLSFTNLTDQTQEFYEYLEDNPAVKKSFEEQFIIGAGYSLTLDRLYQEGSKAKYYIGGSLETSGNLGYLAFYLASGDQPDSNNPYELAGLPFSQYIKLLFEYRRYFRLGRTGIIASRGVAGIGNPYGNSSVMPYIKQYFVGGTNSVRSFVSRSVGPGSYVPETNNLGVDQTGDIKLEANIEYRNNFTKLLRGAVFLDAGNVWLVNEDPDRPGAEFDPGRFMKEIAMGAGFGLRFDMDIIVIRIDLAWPLYSPVRPDGKRWIWSELTAEEEVLDYRGKSPLLNFAIGYPF